MEIQIGGRKWKALQEILDERRDCTDRILLADAIIFDARMYRHSTPIWQDEITCDSYTTIDAVASAMRNYCTVTDEEIACA